MSTAVANWPTFLTKLTNRKEVAERTMTFCFDKPDSFTLPSTWPTAPGGAAILELAVNVPGEFTMMDHAMARMAKGAN